MHDDCDSRIWEAVSVDCKWAHALKQRGEGTPGGLPRWLSAQAPGLRQLSFCDHCSAVGAEAGEEVGDSTAAFAVSAMVRMVSTDLLKLEVGQSSIWGPVHLE